jgi:hypothetical protein
VKVTRGGKASSDDVRNEEPSDAIEGEVFYVDEEKRMDEILKKVSREGIHSLTDSEKKFLIESGERLRRRRGM